MASTRHQHHFTIGSFHRVSRPRRQYGTWSATGWLVVVRGGPCMLCRYVCGPGNARSNTVGARLNEARVVAGARGPRDNSRRRRDARRRRRRWRCRLLLSVILPSFRADRRPRCCQGKDLTIQSYYFSSMIDGNSFRVGDIDELI